MSENKINVMKPGCRRVCFGDVVSQCKVKVDPDTSGLKRYIAGDHMDTDDLRLRRWGEIGSGYLGPAFHMRFKPGQVLYGSRRTYLRKVAVADFDGICANTTFVLEPKNQNELLPSFLPILMQTEAFNDFSVKNSKGSVNPYINFSDLAKFEFTLPSRQEQAAIVRLFQSIGEVSDALHEAKYEIGRLVQATVDDFYCEGLAQGTAYSLNADTEAVHEWTKLTGAELLSEKYVLALQDGNHGSQYPRSDELGDSGLPYIAASDIDDDGEIDLSKVRRLGVVRASELRIPPASQGDVILTHNATVGRVAILPACETPIVASTSTTYYRTNPDKLINAALAAYMRSSFFKAQLTSYMGQSTRNQVPITNQKRMYFLVPPMALQVRIQEVISELQLKKKIIQSRLDSTAVIARQLSGKLLS